MSQAPTSDQNVDAAYQRALDSLSRKQLRSLIDAADSAQSHPPATHRDSAGQRTTAPEVQDVGVYELLAECGLLIPFDWTSWHRGAALLAGNVRIEDATAVECSRLLSMIQRADRFNNGLLTHALANGTISRALRHIVAQSQDPHAQGG